MRQIIPFTKPYIDETIISAVSECLESRWITTGSKVIELQTWIEDKFHVPKSFCVNSWTNGAKLILDWFGVGPGDEVIVPVMTYAASANVVEHCGATVIFVDIGDDLNIDINKIFDVITPNTKVILPVDIRGVSCNYDALLEIINLEEIISQFSPANQIQTDLGRILLLSDAAHSIGAIYKDNYTCNFSDVTIFSLHAVKNITSAEGGIICLNLPAPFDNLEVYNSLRIIGGHGQTKSAFDKYTLGNNWEYDIVCAGYKVNMPDVLASIALAQLQQWDKLIKMRRDICDYYLERLSSINNVDILPLNTINDSNHLMVISINGANSKYRGFIIEELFKQGITSNVHFKPLPLFTHYVSRYDIEDFPFANQVYPTLISLPLFYELSRDEVDYICDTLQNILEE
jgi:dTDP-4-amino-4,6-dideoxygalactose transaminase